MAAPAPMAGGVPLPVPAPSSPALFARLFGDPSLDPQQGRYEHLLADCHRPQQRRQQHGA